MTTEVRVRVGRPQGARAVDDYVNAQIVRLVAEETINRVQRRVDHPAADSLSVTGINQFRADISGPRGGPGIIRPIRAKALRFVPKSGGVVFAKYVRGVGLGPLIEAEANRVDNIDEASIVVP